MGSSGQVSLKEIRKALDDCAPGAVVELKLHHYWVTYSGKTFRGLPSGKHGKTNPEIESGVVKKMSRFLGVLKCMQAKLSI